MTRQADHPYPGRPDCPNSRPGAALMHILGVMAMGLLLAGLLTGCKGKSESAGKTNDYAAPAGRYTLSADGEVVTDHMTRITWKRCVDGMVYSKGECLGVPTPHNYLTVKSIFDDGVSADGWRLPTKSECMRFNDDVVTGGQEKRWEHGIASSVFPHPAVGDGMHYWCSDVERGGLPVLHRYGWSNQGGRLVARSLPGKPHDKDSPVEPETAMLRLVRDRR